MIPHERLTAACVSEIRTHPVCWTNRVRERCTFLTLSGAMVVWHSACLAEASAPLLIRTAFGNRHRIVREHLATFLVEAQDRYFSDELPRFLCAEFERYPVGKRSGPALPA